MLCTVTVVSARPPITFARNVFRLLASSSVRPITVRYINTELTTCCVMITIAITFGLDYVCDRQAVDGRTCFPSPVARDVVSEIIEHESKS